MKQLGALLQELPEELARQVFTHASWSERRSDSYARLAFLGDSVLGAGGDHAPVSRAWRPSASARGGSRRSARRRSPGSPAGRWPSGSGCPSACAPPRRRACRESAAALVETERVLASVIEAVIGACYLPAGYERTAEAVVEAFRPEIEQALEHPVDFKSALQELLAQRGAEVRYEIAGEDGPPHERTYVVVARVDGRDLGERNGQEQEARRAGGRARSGRGARALMRGLTPRGGGPGVHLKSLTLKGFKSFPERTRLDFGPGVSVVVGPNGSGKSNVTDAVLWAMGEQSPLAVRGQSMQDVIFGGGQGVQARSSAEVEIVLDNSDGTVGLPLSGDLDRAPPGPHGRGWLLAERCPLPADRRGRGAVRHGSRQRGPFGHLTGARRADRHLQAARPPPADRGGGRARQAPQATAPRAVEARAHAGEPRPRARRRARGAHAAATAQAPG